MAVVLGPRILSALVLAPLMLAAVWVGSPLFDLLMAGVAGIMAWEWGRLCREQEFDRGGKALAFVSALAAAIAVPAPELALVALAIGGIGLAVFTRSGWLTFGVVYVGLPVLSLVWLREAGGMGVVFWLLALVWATDTGAYAAGRTIGGPKLAPRYSPNKTWAGLGGGMVSAAVVSAGLGLGLEMMPRTLVSGLLLALAGAGLAVVAQIGDLFESAVKRRFGVKDSSTIIPGHGGVLDRVDGLISTAPLVALAVLLLGRGAGL